MKHRFVIVVQIILCLTVLTGCQRSGGVDMTTNVSADAESQEVFTGEVVTDGVSIESTSAEENSTSEMSTEAESTSADSIETDPAPKFQDTILQARTPWGGSGNLYEVPLDALEGIAQSEVYRFGNDLLLTYSVYDQESGQSIYVVKLVSLETGEVLQMQQLKSLTFAQIQILDHHVAVKDLGDGKCYLLDSELAEVGTYELVGGRFCLHPAGEKAYVFTYDQGIREVDLTSGQVNVLLDQAVNLYQYDASREYAAFVYTDRDTLMREAGILDLRSGQIQVIASPYAYSGLEVGQNTWLGKVDTEEPLYVLSDGTSQRMFRIDLAAMAGVNGASGHVMISEMTADGGTVFSVYDAEGEGISKCDATELMDSQGLDLAWYEEYGGYVFSLMDHHGQDHLLFWDVSTDNVETALECIEVEKLAVAPAGAAVSQNLYEQAAVLSQKYGVEILIADQCDTAFTDHEAEPLLVESEIRQALNTLDHVLGRYPQGFFEQCKHDTYKEIEIQILGMLKKSYSTEDTIYISGGFVTTAYPGKLLMALDARAVDPQDAINPILAGTMYHEISHMIDKRLAFDARYREDAVYTDSGWEALNPAGFAYNESYYGTLDPEYEDYFVDAYACTNATEDRARIMEYAMLGEVDLFADKEGLAKKLAYYGEAIRDSFDTTGWPENLPWELISQQ